MTPQFGQLLTSEELSNLLREKFMGPDGAHRLSQVLATIFGTRKPVEVMGKVTIHQPDADTPALEIVPFPGTTVTPVAGGGGSSGGGLSPTAVTWPSGATPPAPSLAGKFPVVLYGVIQSGSGNNYVVRCWLTDPSAGTALGDFNCYQAQIDSAEALPAGTHCLVWCSVNASNRITAMRLLVPVFLGPPS